MKFESEDCGVWQVLDGDALNANEFGVRFVDIECVGVKTSPADECVSILAMFEVDEAGLWTVNGDLDRNGADRGLEGRLGSRLGSLGVISPSRRDRLPSEHGKYSKFPFALAPIICSIAASIARQDSSWDLAWLFNDI